MPFDPNAPYETLSRAKTRFDPNAPYEIVSRASAPAVQPPQMTKLERFGTGLKDPLEGAAQLLSHAVPPSVERTVTHFGNWLNELGLPVAKLSEGGDGTAMDRDVKQREAAIKATSPAGTDLYRLAGEVASPLNFVAPEARAAGAVTKGALAGARGAAMEPTTEDGLFLPEKMKQIVAGTAGGGALGGVGKATSRAAAPKLSAGTKELLDAGVKLTPGQMGGGSYKTAEDIAKNVPLMGSGVLKQQLAAIDSFNVATANKALEPIGVKLPMTLSGRGIVAEGQQHLSDAYDKLLPNMVFREDPAFRKDLDTLSGMVTELAQPQREQFAAIMRNRVDRRLDQTGTMLGNELNMAQGELRTLSQQYRASQDASQRQLGDAIDAVREAMQDALERQNPAQAKELQDIRRSYAMFSRVSDASVRRAGSDGRFTPTDLLQSVKTADKSRGKRTFARGDGLLQDWAQLAHDHIGHNLPDSQTAARTLGLDAAGALLTGSFNPKLLAGMAAGRGVYSDLGTAAARGVAQPGPRTQAAASAFEQLGPLLAPGSSYLVGNSDPLGGLGRDLARAAGFDVSASRK